MPQLALLLCILCIAYLLWADRASARGVSTSIWIPLMWIFFSGSRFPNQWMDLGPPIGMSVQDYLDGSPLDRLVFLALIIAGIAVLSQRRVKWSATLRSNSWLFLFLLFAAISALWSDYPIVSLKRWVKVLGNIVMALIILTEERPLQALGFILRRLAYVLLPLSVLFIRYFPDLGRDYHADGSPMFTGVAFQKNGLGLLCMLLIVYFSWDLLFGRMNAARPQGTTPVAVRLLIFPMLFYLMYMSDSATCISALVTAGCVLLVARLPYFVRRPRRLVGAGIVVAAVAAFLEYTFQVSAWVIQALGRDPSLTGRGPVWELLLQMADSPWVGAGYESFMAGDRLTEIWARLNMQEGAGQAHNGYIDMYLNLGIIGLGLLITAILMGLIDALKQLDREYGYAVLRISLILIAIQYNVGEAAFKPLNNVFVLLLFSILQVSMIEGKPSPLRRFAHADKR